MSGELERLQRATVLKSRTSWEVRRGRYESSIPSVDQLLQKHLVPGGNDRPGTTTTANEPSRPTLSYVQQLQQEQEKRVADAARASSANTDAKQRLRSRKKRALYRAITPRYMLPKAAANLAKSKSAHAQSLSRSSTNRSTTTTTAAAAAAGRTRAGRRNADNTKEKGRGTARNGRATIDTLPAAVNSSNKSAGDNPTIKGTLKSLSAAPPPRRRVQFNQVEASEHGTRSGRSTTPTLERQRTVVSFDLQGQDQHSSGRRPSLRKGSMRRRFQRGTTSRSTVSSSSSLSPTSAVAGLSRQQEDLTTAAAMDSSSARGKFLKSLRHSFRLRDSRHSVDHSTMYLDDEEGLRQAHRPATAPAFNSRNEPETSAVSSARARSRSRTANTIQHGRRPRTSKPLLQRHDTVTGNNNNNNLGADADSDDYFSHCERHDLIPEFGDIKPMVGATCSRTLFYAHRQVSAGA